MQRLCSLTQFTTVTLVTTIDNNINKCYFYTKLRSEQFISCALAVSFHGLQQSLCIHLPGSGVYILDAVYMLNDMQCLDAPHGSMCEHFMAIQLTLNSNNLSKFALPNEDISSLKHRSSAVFVMPCNYSVPQRQTHTTNGKKYLEKKTCICLSSMY